MRKKMTAIVLAVLVFSLIAASAASLGGINTADVGAEVDAVAGCDDTGIIVDFSTSYDPTSGVNGEYVVDGVIISDVAAACDGDDIEVTLTDGAGVVLATVGGAGLASSTVTNLAVSPGVSAAALEGVAVVISG